jgi:four helix bundle protein
MRTSGFDSLHVYRLSEELADALWDMVEKWGRFAQDTIGKQMVRCADSVGANIAEGHGRGSYQDNRRFIRIARGSLNETRHWLRRAFKRRLMTEEQVNKIQKLVDELGPRLNAYLTSIGPANNK